MKALLFGSIGTLVETSELQRAAFNDAFTAHNLSWHWARQDYQNMLATSGGQQRIARYAASLGEEVDARAIHATKSDLFQTRLAEQTLHPRPGTAALAAAATDHGMTIGFVTTTEAKTVTTICNALTRLGWPAFDILTSRDDGAPAKPDPAIYDRVLRILGLKARDALAIEDNADGVAAAKAAGLFTVGFPGANTRAEDLIGADLTVEDGLKDAVLPKLLGNLEAAQ
ncbi:MAG: HAD-IA family hydrolase [Pseudomonadota bacterium]